ncbi:riboflavin synthase [Porphyromonas sp. HMSC065F10]|uniref:riboflavin synthase n=1 Tax=Porphyromonas sp. HMSC065F10 TaxID=1739394 RepID=UPI0008A311F8|nr:riboflavin synthase [Porphyromonas sp. HMSC065F10]OFR35396.1 riboflavin synthase subunit alpha [Porphyromonas sp. HMSC065F10]
MFSGIVETTAKVLRVDHPHNSTNVNLTLTVPFWDELAIDQSVAHNGVCLTVVSIHPEEKSYTVTAVQETLERSNLGDLKPGDRVNVERSMRSDGRLDGHIVQGHVDTTAECIRLEDVGGSTYYTFRYSVPDEMAARGYTTVEKGSVCINGVSLTVVDSERDTFKVAIIPYTKEITNFGDLSEGKRVNLEFDIIGKYLAKLITFRQ